MKNIGYNAEKMFLGILYSLIHFKKIKWSHNILKPLLYKYIKHFQH
jgi:hypothetical protein